MKYRRIVLVLAILAMIACVVQPVLAEMDTNTSNASIYYNRGSLAASGGDFERALVYFDMALASNTSLVAKSDTLTYIYKDKAAVLTDLGQYEEAVKTADQGLALYKKDPGLWNNKGYALYKQSKYDDAISAYTNAISAAEAQNTTYLKGYLNKGIALNAAGRPYDAVGAFNKVLELDPGNTDATAGLAEAQAAATKLTIVLAVIVIVALGIVIWYVKFRKPADSKAATGKKEKRSKK
ncbi:tetratricopeptide repeat protein [Methanoregula sp.]|uniref:tetratricopeptide repeat protein n=1 Tax=Methanoregula sp. TaxID=2052170 RepID=UPI0035651DD1